MEYKIPESGKVSNELRDLLSKILMEDPQQRISIQDIMKHPWFLKDLPQGVLEMNEELPEPGDDVQVGFHVHQIIKTVSNAACLQYLYSRFLLRVSCFSIVSV